MAAVIDDGGGGVSAFNSRIATESARRSDFQTTREPGDAKSVALYARD